MIFPHQKLKPFVCIHICHMEGMRTSLRQLCMLLFLRLMTEYQAEINFTKEKQSFWKLLTHKWHVLLLSCKAYILMIFPHQKLKHLYCLHCCMEVFMPLVYLFHLLNLPKIPSKLA